MKKYERMLDVAIGTAAKNRTRFPLKLFFVVVNMSVLISWVALLVGYTVQQTAGLIPPAINAGCHMLADSSAFGLMQNVTPPFNITRRQLRGERDRRAPLPPAPPAHASRLALRAAPWRRSLEDGESADGK